MKQFIVIIGILFLSGCMYQEVDREDLIVANHYCLDKDGIKELRPYFHGNIVFECNNGDYEARSNLEYNFEKREFIK